MNIKTIAVVGAVWLIALSFIAFREQPVQPAPIVNNNLGALSGPDIPYEYIGISGARLWGKGMTLAKGTSTPCRLEGPAATSTLIAASVTFTTATGTALNVDIAKTSSALPFASTTNLITEVITGGFKATIVATSTANQANNRIFSPNDLIVVKVAAPAEGTNIHDNPTGFVPEGTCSGLWLVQ